MRLSIVIPLYLGRQVIAQCLDSILQRGLDDYEIIIVDDSSPDGSGRLVATDYPMVKLISSKKNHGYAVSVNRGLSAARGDYILLLNQDTIIKDDAIEKLIRVLDDRRDIVAVAPQLLGMDGSIQKSCRMLPTYRDVFSHHLLLAQLFSKSRLFGRWQMKWFSHDREAFVEQPSFSAILIRRETIDEIGMLDERFRLFFNDVDYCRRIADRGENILFYPEAQVVHHKGQATSQVPFRKIFESIDGFIRYFLKYNHGAIHVIPNALIVVLLELSGIVRFSWLVLSWPFTSRRSSSSNR